MPASGTKNLQSLVDKQFPDEQVSSGLIMKDLVGPATWQLNNMETGGDSVLLFCWNRWRIGRDISMFILASVWYGKGILYVMG